MTQSAVHRPFSHTPAGRAGRVGLIYLGLLPPLVAMLFPYFIMILTSLKTTNEANQIPPTWLPTTIQFGNYIEIFTRIPLARFFANSLIIAGGATLVCIAAAIPAAYALSRLHFFGRKLLMYGLLVTQMFSPIVLIIAFFRMMSGWGLIDNHLGLIIANAAFNVAFATWLLVSFFEALPVEIEEAAYVDGASRLQTIEHIVLPLSKPGIVTVTVFVFIQSWNEFIFALTFITSEDNRPLTTGIFGFTEKYDVLWNYLFGAAVLTVIPVLILFILIERQFVKGLVAGALKD